MISKIRHETCQMSDFLTECYMGGQMYNMVLYMTSRAFYAVENSEKLMF